jgi:hypothetical protein
MIFHGFQGFIVLLRDDTYEGIDNLPVGSPDSDTIYANGVSGFRAAV